MTDGASLWAPRAWVSGGWKEHVLLRVGVDGRWAEVTPGVIDAPAGATVLAGPLLPGLVDAHSHAFQRAFAGLAEWRDSRRDDFWSWRDRMYKVALRITPEQHAAVVAHLYIELLRGGYTQVCEFHYLHNDPDGRAYADPLELSWSVADAAAEAGIGLTLLPVLYERAGFAQPALRDDQRRFRASAEQVWGAQRAIAASGRPLLNAGVAIHSLRAATPSSIDALRSLVADFEGPIHIHAAEQTGEVDECVAATGARPVEWLAHEGLLDSRWQLVHATHCLPEEIDAVAKSGAGVVLCPGTEGNLGDGVPDLPRWLDADVPIALGSDSQITRDWREELRWLEYAQRLTRRQRNIAASPRAGISSTAERLFSRLLDGGRAAGEKRWGIVVGARADALVVDSSDPSLLGIPAPQLLDALVFSSPTRPWRDVLVAGRWVVRDHHHAHAAAIAQRFEAAMDAIWRDG
ncbi:MAG: formimidoylglutamate deiminase [Betaproteobacteria bacterium]